MSCVWKWRLIVTCGLLLAAGQLHAAPSIVGDSVEIWGVAQSNGMEYLNDTVQVIDPGVEYTATIIGDIYNLNIGPSSIVLNTLDDWFSPWFNSGYPPTTLEIRGIDVPGMPGLSIGGVSVLFSETIVPEANAPMGYPAFSAANVTFSAHSVALQTGPYLFPTGSRVQIDLAFVPEPGMTGLFGCGVFGALVRVRRRKCVEVV